MRTPRYCPHCHYDFYTQPSMDNFFNAVNHGLVIDCPECDLQFEFIPVEWEVMVL